MAKPHGAAGARAAALYPAHDGYVGLLLLACGLISLGYLLLPALAPLAWLPAWQLPLSVALFIGEFYLRKRLFPTHNHPGFKEYLMIVAKAMAHPPRTR